MPHALTFIRYFIVIAWTLVAFSAHLPVGGGNLLFVETKPLLRLCCAPSWKGGVSLELLQSTAMWTNTCLVIILSYICDAILSSKHTMGCQETDSVSIRYACSTVLCDWRAAKEVIDVNADSDNSYQGQEVNLRANAEEQPDSKPKCWCGVIL